MKDILFRNFALKILAFVFAVVLWLFVVGEKGTEIGFLVPLELKGIPDEFMVVNEVKNFIEVRLSGPRTLLTSLSPGQMRIAIDLSKSQKGINTFQILPEDIKVPRGIKVTGVRPGTVTIVLEKVITVSVPVKLRITGRPLRGFKITERIVNPRKVSLTGAENDLRRLKSISTVPVDISGISSDLNTKVSLKLDNLKIAKVEPDIVEANIRLEEIKREKGGRPK